MQYQNYQSVNEINDFVNSTQKGVIVVGHYNMTSYMGMVQYIGITFDTEKNKYELNLEWIAMALDFYGDTLQESYVYQFENIEQILDYISKEYSVAVTDIPKKYNFDKDNFPILCEDKEQKQIYQKEWKSFQEDFKIKLFLDESLKLVYSSR